MKLEDNLVSIGDVLKLVKSYKIYTYDRNGYIETSDKIPKESISALRKDLIKISKEKLK